ncbi:MAG: universal stress protein [Chloroflexi bacterium]|nr:universal stress protein [Chloroflexota bacterium]MDA1270783.1 universal stress protein [Chloroflexota bacterium]
MYKRILVPLDGSPLGDRVLPYVRTLGRKLEAKVELFRVFEPQPEYFYPNPFDFKERHEASEHHREEVMTAMGAAKTQLERAGVAAIAVMHGPDIATLEDDEIKDEKKDHRYGAPAEHIVTEAEKEKDTLIVMSTHGRSGVGRWVLGSVTDKVLHAAKMPLLIIRAEDNDAVLDGSMGHIIVPLDGSALAESILPHAAAMAKALDAKVCLVRATANHKADSKEKDGLERVADKLRAEGVPEVSGLVLHGDPATAIVNLTHEYPDALVAMTTHGRSGVGRWLIGSVADRVVRHAAGPVLLLRGSTKTG